MKWSAAEVTGSFSRDVTRSVPVLGERELAVMKVLWQDSEQTAQQVLEALTESPIPSLSTVQSTLERLYRKGLLNRIKIERSYCYRAQISRSALIGSLVADIAERVGDGQMAPMVSGFMTFMDAKAPSSDANAGSTSATLWSDVRSIFERLKSAIDHR